MEFSGARRQFYPHLESLRGVAALCVVLFHVFGSRSPQPGLFAHPTSDAIANLILTSIFGGTGAVTLFFVLSGFVLAESLAECETINVRIYAAFVVRRIFRLIPVAWASLGLAIVLMIYFHHMTPPWDQLPQALLFNISAIQPFNGPLWSINVECMASAVFPLLLLANRKLNMAGRLLMLLGLLLIQNRSSFIATQYLFCFQIGIMTRELMIPLLRRLDARWSSILLGTAIALVLLPTNASRLGLISQISHVRLESIGSVYLVGYAIFDRDSRLVRFLELAPMRFLGRISYSLYAYHYPIIGSLSFIAWGIIPADHYVPAQLLCAAMAVPATIMLAAIGYWCLEHPMHKLGRALGNRITWPAPQRSGETDASLVGGRV
jgi:peptidoglycan/LPS O-acetylase OafA/YrhL